MTRKKPPSAVRRRQRRAARSRAFEDSARLDWMDKHDGSIARVQTRMLEYDGESVRQAIDSLRSAR